MELHELLLQRAHTRLQELNSELAGDQAEWAEMSNEGQRELAQLAHVAGAHMTAVAQMLDERTIDPGLALALYASAGTTRARKQNESDIEEHLTVGMFLRANRFLSPLLDAKVLVGLSAEAAAIRATGAPSNAVDA